ncbi:DUF1203 domain-containing protein [Jannaschia ovalis]|uniref:DUF1203 domain-containing protein n=1 Tax=Jannaschia ovalis TaxID=3038773 RepID=A0ABY8L902_9RHOB|nr:DUF1203 domain-containing protein [Jannaschia sp. GRR-S6-38]WGH77764.1 DUF1203 domain-containing protein [Jannaschia sp. GRR-S6-38]
MAFRIHPLPAAPFADLFVLEDGALAARNARRVTVTEKPGAPCRISLEDAEPGEDVLLVNHMHLDAASPYRACHAIYVRRGVAPARPARGAVPDSIASRYLALRALDADGMIRDAALTPGAEAAETLERFLSDPMVEQVHIYYAARGCYAARATRA